jgi:putative phosphoserine phosphatase/1-acylglycerol-3-phosphate O-acyltransferase
MTRTAWISLEEDMGIRPIGAFFDFDRTLIDVESPKLGIRYLWERGQISLLYVLKIMAANVLYKRNLISDEAMARILISFYRNKPLAPFEAGSQEYYQEVIRPHLAPNIVAKVREHKAKDHVLILISAGLRYLLKPVVKDLGFDHLICTDLEMGTDGILTGNTRGPICSDSHKRAYAEELAKELNMDLGSSYAYGDHHADIPLLELVGNPRAVEPTEQLRKVALERGWPILSFR